jgi:hypothetical protein
LSAAAVQHRRRSRWRARTAMREWAGPGAGGRRVMSEEEVVF